MPISDAGKRLVEEVKDFHLSKSVRSTPFSEFGEVLVRWEESGVTGGRPHEKTIWLATVRLVRTDGEDLFLSSDTNGLVSLDLARKVAVAQLPLRDETAGDGGTEE